MNSFSVTYHEFGIIISTPIGIEELIMLYRFYKKNQKYDTVDFLIGSHYHGICVTSKDGSEQWREEIGLTKEKKC